MLIKVWAYLANCYNCDYLASWLCVNTSIRRRVSQRMTVFGILIRWASAPSAPGFRGDRSLALVTQRRHHTAAHHHSAYKMYTQHDQDTRGLNREPLPKGVNHTAAASRFLASKARLTHALSDSHTHTYGQTPARQCAVTSLAQRMQNDSPGPFLSP